MKIIPLAKKRPLHTIEEKAEDTAYWLKQSPKDRIAAVTFIISQSLKPGQRMDKSHIVKRKMKE